MGQTWDGIGTKTEGHERPKQRIEPSKILSKSLPGGFPRHPKSVPGASPSTLEQRKITCDPKVGQKVAKVGRKSAQRGQSGTQVGPKNRPKSSPDRQKCFPRWRRKRFSSISCAISVRSHIPDRFWEGLNLQNPIISTVGARFSQNHGFHIFLEF